jgi:hypothetical protein
MCNSTTEGLPPTPGPSPSGPALRRALLGRLLALAGLSAFGGLPTFGALPARICSSTLRNTVMAGRDRLSGPMSAESHELSGPPAFQW